MKNVTTALDLCLKPDGRVYHLALYPHDIADTIILVGDPGRVPKVSKYFDRIEVEKQNREFVSHTGCFNGKRLTVMSTGIGTDNIDICINELDALVNVDLKTRKIKDKTSKLNLVRIGTSRSLQVEIPVDSYVVSTYGIGLDVLMSYYQRTIDVKTCSITRAFIEHLGSDVAGLCPYICKGSDSLLSLFKDTCISGITVSGAGFYAPQGRRLRYKLAKPNLINKLLAFDYCGDRIANFEMETSAIYGLGQEILGHNCCSINLILANQQTGKISDNINGAMEKMIQMSLEKLSSLK